MRRVNLIACTLNYNFSESTFDSHHPISEVSFRTVVCLPQYLPYNRGQVPDFIFLTIHISLGLSALMLISLCLYVFFQNYNWFVLCHIMYTLPHFYASRGCFVYKDYNWLVLFHFSCVLSFICVLLFIRNMIRLFLFPHNDSFPLLKIKVKSYSF